VAKYHGSYMQILPKSQWTSGPVPVAWIARYVNGRDRSLPLSPVALGSRLYRARMGYDREGNFTHREDFTSCISSVL